MTKRLQGRQLYFAYGSNLSSRQMLRRCPSARSVGRGYLDRWRIAFDGYSASWGGAVADVVRDDKSWVEGVLYEMSARDVLKLDTYEGCPTSYVRRRLHVTLASGKQRAAFVYVQSGFPRRVTRVSDKYFKAVYDAYRRLGFDNEWLLLAKRECNTREAEAPPTHRVFVYGSLLSGEPNNDLLFEASLEKEAYTKGHFSLYSLGAYPCMTPGGDTEVYGEVYQVDDATLARLDRLEGHPSLYQRTAVSLRNGDTVEAYLMREEQVRGREPIASGDWRDHAYPWPWKEEDSAY